MQVINLKDNKKIEIKANTVKELLEKLNLNETTVIVTRNNEIILDNTKLLEKDKIKIIPIVSGG